MELGLVIIIPLGLLLVAGYLQLQRRWRHLRRDEQLILGRARQKALHIIQTARDQALQIISAGKISASESKLKLKDGLEKISAEQLREFQKLLTNVSKSIEIDALKEVEDFRQALELETVKSIERQKARRLKELDGQIQTLVADVVKRITGKTIPIAEHEQLIIKALEDAKRRHFI